MKYLLLLTSLLLGCAPLSTVGTYRRPANLCSHPNTHNYRIDVFLEGGDKDSMGRFTHIQWIRWADPSEHVCTSWEMADDRGRWMYVAHNDTTYGLWFQGWALR